MNEEASGKMGKKRTLVSRTRKIKLKKKSGIDNEARDVRKLKTHRAYGRQKSQCGQTASDLHNKFVQTDYRAPTSLRVIMDRKLWRAIIINEVEMYMKEE